MENESFYIGIESESIPTFGLKTMYVVGLQEPNDILQVAKLNSVDVINFGANNSLDAHTAGEWDEWEDMILFVLDDSSELTCSLTIDINNISELHEGGLCENNRFMPLIYVNLPYIDLLNYNSVIRFTDDTRSNAGVWSHRVHNLQNENNFTQWDKLSS